MFIIPGWLISILTFPGVIIHEWAHKKFCEYLGVPVHEVVYFRIGNPAGYVIHDPPDTYKQTFWVSVGPLIINSLAAIIFSFFTSQAINGSGLWYFLLWVAFSAGMHSFPSDHDMEHVANASKVKIKEGGSFLHYLAFPFVWLIWIANKLRFFWFDAIYAVFLIFVGSGIIFNINN